MAADPEGWLASAIWRACLHNGHPITVPASRWAAATAIHHLGPPLPTPEWPALCYQLHEAADKLWYDPARLAVALRRFADGLDSHAQADTPPPPVVESRPHQTKTGPPGR